MKLNRFDKYKGYVPATIEDATILDADEVFWIESLPPEAKEWLKENAIPGQSRLPSGFDERWLDGAKVCQLTVGIDTEEQYPQRRGSSLQTPHGSWY